MFQRILTGNVTELVAGNSEGTGIAVIIDSGATFEGATLDIRWRQKGSSGAFASLDNTLVAGDQQSYLIGPNLEIAVSVTGAGSPAPNIPIFINRL